MIDALDLALANLLNDASAPTDVHDAETSFEPLERTYRPTVPTVNLFLVGLHQNLDLRSFVPVREPSSGGYVEEPPPIRVDCRYLVTVWTAGTTPAQRVADEHRLLGSLMSWLGRFAVLPSATLGPRLAAQPVPIRLSVGLPHPERELSDLWSALGVSPRAAIWLSAMLALPTGSAGIVGEPVTDVNVRLHEGKTERVQLHVVGGRVRVADAPLAAALVSIGALDRRADTDTTGVFRLGSVPEGTYQLEVSAPGHQTAIRTVHVPPAADDDYDVELAPKP